jgi:hypothetical protein
MRTEETRTYDGGTMETAVRSDVVADPTPAKRDGNGGNSISPRGGSGGGGHSGAKIPDGDVWR